jgi:hypothetical protein
MPDASAATTRFACGAAILVPLVVGLVGHAAGNTPRPIGEGPSRPGLAFDQYLVDLGEVPPSEEVFAHFGFRNSGEHTVTVRELSPSCGCLKPELRKRIYQPGESGRFHIRVQTANEAPGPHEYRIAVRYNDPQPREAVVLFRVVLPDNQVFVRPRALIFYQMSDQPTTQEIEIIDRRPEHLRVERVECSKDFVQIEQAGGSTDAAGHWRGKLKITVPGDLPRGRREALVQIVTSDPEYRTLRVPLIIQSGQPRKVSDPKVRPAGGTRRWQAGG